MKQIFLTLLSRLWDLTSCEVEPMGKNRAMRLMLIKAHQEHPILWHRPNGKDSLPRDFKLSGCGVSEGAQ